MSYQDAINLSSHYIAIGMTQLALSYDEEKPWHLVSQFVAPSEQWGRSSLTQDIEFVGYDPISSLTFTWTFDIDLADGVVDLDACRDVIKELPPTAVLQFKEHIKTCVKLIYDEGTQLIDQGKKEQNDALILSQLIQP